MAYPASTVANYFLDLAEAEGKQLSPMQLQKLVYFAHGWYLALTGQLLVNEHVEAWKFGPVFPSLYQAFKQYGGGPILGRAPKPDTDTDSVTVISEADKRILRRVWEVYGSWSAEQLSQLTHLPNGPWHKTRRQNPNRLGSDIPDSDIREYFLRKAKTLQEA
jgi:uncharacterized phage-associated protein